MQRTVRRVARRPGIAAHTAPHAHETPAPHAHGATPLSALARTQVDSARAIIAAYDTPAKARAAGFRPLFGDIPLQGEHFVHRARMLQGTFDLARPAMLMFSPLGDSAALVGAAYAYFVPDSVPDPEGFDGDADAWHGHPMFTLAERRLTMVHLWLTDTPDGPFAHDNVTLPFAARGLALPPLEWLPAEQRRELGVALALAAGSGDRLVRAAGVGGRAVQDTLESQRARINALADSLGAAMDAGDRARYVSLAARARETSSAFIEGVRNSPPTAPMREMAGRLVDEFIGTHRGGGHP